MTKKNANKKKSASKAPKTFYPVLIGAALVGIVAVLFFWLGPSDKSQESLVEQRAPLDDTTPIPITPQQPGVTIVQKMPETEEAEIRRLSAPVQEGAAAATGYAIDLGSALSFSALTERFAQINQLNGSESFLRLEPRALLRNTESGLQARLLVGPFLTLQDAETACRRLKLPQQKSCFASPFEGELIARQ